MAEDVVELIILLTLIIVWDELIIVSVELMTGETFIAVCDWLALLEELENDWYATAPAMIAIITTAIIT